MACAISKGYTFGSTELITNIKLHALVDSATIAGVANANVADDANINITKIAVTNQAAGDILYFNGTAWVRLAKGTGGATLKMNAGGTAPEWV